MKILAIISLVSLSLIANGQDSTTILTNQIVEEGKLLYKCEMASWYGTDLFLGKNKGQQNIGGYFSYLENGFARCIFFSKEENPQVIGTVSFDSTYNTKTADINMESRGFTPSETVLYSIRKAALAEIYSDTLFKTYKNTQLNLIPIISNGEKKVYVLTGPQQNGVMIIGNDYLLKFDTTNKVRLKKQLHKNIIPIYFDGKEMKGKEIEAAVHSHLPETGEFITATDICTLMLYSKFVKWKTHNVVSKSYLNIWNCETNTLTVVPMEAVKKIYNDSKE